MHFPPATAVWLERALHWTCGFARRARAAKTRKHPSGEGTVGGVEQVAPCFPTKEYDTIGSAGSRQLPRVPNPPGNQRQLLVLPTGLQGRFGRRLIPSSARFHLLKTIVQRGFFCAIFPHLAARTSASLAYAREVQVA